MWVLGTKPRFNAREINALTIEQSLQPHLCTLIFFLLYLVVGRVDQRTACGNWFSSLIIQVLEFQLKLLRCDSKPLYLLNQVKYQPLVYFFFFFKYKGESSMKIP